MPNKRDKTFVTIFCDASFIPNENRGGWACAIMYKGELYKYSHTFSTKVYSAAEAEIKACANGLWYAEESGLLTDKPIVMIQNDSREALCAILASNKAFRTSYSKHNKDVRITRRRGKPRSEWLKPLKYITEIHDNRGVVIMLRHVKGHQGGTSRHNLNELTDRLAKAAANGR